ncbi:hypothetical protein [Dactylosporangium sp. NPDC048998]|uniref:hypothetical protein n=1 Tax=Dactylosporangium sp. NPDC048998 TaxID=3363976 RepID=UPI003715B0F6
MTIKTRMLRGRGQAVARGLITTAVVAAAVLVTGTAASAAGPHFSFTPSFIAYTDSATPNTTTFYPSGDLPVGAHVINGVVHKTRVYFGFDIGGVERARLKTARLAVTDTGAADCTKPHALSARPVAEFTSTNTWKHPPAEAGKAVKAVPESQGCTVHVGFDLTEGLDKALKANAGRLWVEVAVPDGDEPKPAYGRYLWQNDFHLEVTLTNTPPAAPTRLTYSDGTACSDGTYYTGYDLSLNADQTDPDPGDMLTTEIEYWPLTDPGNVTSVPTSQGSGGDGTFGVGFIRASAIAEGTYGWHARTYDQRAYSPWSVTCTFAIDKTAPNMPAVSSVEYPENPPAPTGGSGQPGTFVFTANGSSDVVDFRYGTSPFSLYNRVAADALGGSATVRWTPRGVGEQTLYVASYDRAHNQSPVRAYKFNVRSYGVSVWPIEWAPDPAGSLGVVVTMHFSTQVGNGLTKFGYSVDGGEQHFAPVGADGIADVALPPIRSGEHTLTYSGLDSAGTVRFETSTIFYAVDEPAVESDDVYPIEGSGGGVGVEGVFTVTPFIGTGVQSVEYFTTQDTNPVTVPIDADGKARVHWTPTQTGWTYFWFTVRYTDGTTSSYHSFSTTVND